MNLIDRDKLIEELEKREYGITDNHGEECCGMSTEDFERLIVAQPTVNNWIPVERALPDYGEVVLLKIRDGEDYWFDNIVTGKRRKENPLMQRREDYITTGMIIHGPRDVIAWKPIEPYTGDKDV